MKKLLTIAGLAFSLALPSVAQVQILADTDSIPRIGDTALYVTARLMLTGADAERFDVLMDVFIVTSDESDYVKLKPLLDKGRAAWAKYAALNKENRTPDEEKQFQEYRKLVDANMPGLRVLADKNFRRMEVVRAEHKEEEERDAAVRAAEAVFNKARWKTDVYFVITQMQDSVLLKNLLAIINNDLENAKAANHLSAPQITQLASEAQVKLSFIQVAQNRRLVEQNEQTIKQNKQIIEQNRYSIEQNRQMLTLLKKIAEKK